MYCADDAYTNFEKIKDLKTWILLPSVKPLSDSSNLLLYEYSQLP